MIIYKTDRFKGVRMGEFSQIKKNDLLYPRSRYYGDFKPENLAFNANLQEFAQKVSFITCLQTAGKLESHQAYKDIELLWEELKKSKRELGIGQEPPISG